MRIASVYAKAFLETIDPKNRESVVKQEQANIRALLDLLEESKILKTSLFGFATSSREKSQIIETLAQKMGFSELLNRFLILLAKKGRLSILEHIHEALEVVRLEAEGGILGHVVSADELNREDIDDLAKAFAEELGKKVEFKVSEDPSLLAGVKVTVNGVTYDGTLKAQLESLKGKFVRPATGATQ